MHSLSNVSYAERAASAFELAATASLAGACLKEALHWESVSHMELTAYAFCIAFVIHDFFNKWLVLRRRSLPPKLAVGAVRATESVGLPAARALAANHLPRVRHD